jgi:hypothetical protein
MRPAETPKRRPQKDEQHIVLCPSPGTLTTNETHVLRLLLRTLGLGDFLTGVPAYRAVRRAFPGHPIVLAAPGGLADLVPLTGAIDELLPAAEPEPVAWTGAPPDVAIDLHGRGLASHRLLAALGPRRLITFGGRHGGGFAGPGWRAGSTRWPAGAGSAQNPASPPTPPSCGSPRCPLSLPGGSVALADRDCRETGGMASPGSSSVFAGFRFRGR